MYYFYLDNMRLPVTPSKLQIKINNQNKTMNLINEGEINILKTPGLTDISFACLLPVTRYPFAKYPELSTPIKFSIRDDFALNVRKGRGLNIVKPSIYLNIFEQLKIQCTPFKFTVIRTVDGYKVDEDTNFTVSLEDYTIKEDASDGSDMSVEVKLKQYKNYGTKTIAIVENTATVTEARETTATNTVNTENTANSNEQYTIVKGDTLSGIAKRKLGSASRWKEIYELNKSTIEAAAKAHGKSSSCNGQWIYPGTVLQIPAS